jgi:hypothetical protein
MYGNRNDICAPAATVSATAANDDCSHCGAPSDWHERTVERVLPVCPVCLASGMFALWHGAISMETAGEAAT